MSMQQAPNCSERTHKSDFFLFFFFFKPNGLKNASETISAVGKMKSPSKKYIIIPKNSLCYPAERVLGNTPRASESFVRSRNQQNFSAEPLHYCHGNCKLNREGMTECSRKWTPRLRCPSLKFLMNDYKAVIPCLTKNPESPKIGTAQSRKGLHMIFKSYVGHWPKAFFG